MKYFPFYNYDKILLEGRVCKKILIVEDDEKLRKEFEIFLNNNGYESISLKTFENTLNDILEIKPKLLLLDINYLE